MLQFETSKNKIYITNSNEFNIEHILECGQVFRYKKLSFGYEVYSLNHKATITCHEMHTMIECDDVNYFINYFDLLTDYAKIKQELSKDKLLCKAIKFGEGIRILKQDSLETIISFIISQNNNIPRIKKIIEDICQHYGKKMNGYYAFPNLDSLAKISKEFFIDIKSGYRADYLYTSIQMLANNFNLDIIKSMPSNQANKYLTQLKGVGVKVADCILLFGFYKTDVFPTDTWIKKVFNDYYPNQQLTALDVRNKFIDKFGEKSGYAQQYLFYYKRESFNNKV